MSGQRKENKKLHDSTQKKTPREDQAALSELCRQVYEVEDGRVVFEWEGRWYALMTMEELEYLEELEDHVSYEAVEEALSERGNQGQPLLQIGPIPDDKEKH